MKFAEQSLFGAIAKKKPHRNDSRMPSRNSIFHFSPLEQRSNPRGRVALSSHTVGQGLKSRNHHFSHYLRKNAEVNLSVPFPFSLSLTPLPSSFCSSLPFLYSPLFLSVSHTCFSPLCLSLPFTIAPSPFSHPLCKHH